ncbi:hypothetical protein OFN97_05820 [Campylobacter sp. VBCF_05 NA6]|uniref:hypothetical protein n=1 Tax=unclassified Campylobacter TaxID=2593542 RepID=UPI0022E9C364|nr:MULTISPECIES: hypothetical protein [unclassified Campylobacter]MDA3057158.1 hypothetical protein [Campylobacter sp. VBCF_04 NA7]MDA3059532.1 hypothetical protein [Campylobacter sp. VBCF_05 NA6]
MKKKVKILSSVLFVILLIHLSLLYLLNLKVNIADTYCYNLSDEEIVQNFLKDSFLQKTKNDDIEPKFYLIGENPTTQEVLQKLKYIVENDTNKTQEIIERKYKDATKKVIISENLNILQALNKHYTLKNISENIVSFSREKWRWVVSDVPLDTAMTVGDYYTDIEEGKGVISIYGSDAFIFHKENSSVEIKMYKFYYPDYPNYIEYMIVNGNIKKKYESFEIDDLKKRINLDLQYYLEDYLKNGAKSNNSYKNFHHDYIKVNSCGIAKNKKQNSVIY